MVQKVNVSEKLIEMIKHDEGVKTSPYQCPALLWTIGVGHVIDPNHAKVKLADRKQLDIPDGWDRVLNMVEVNDILKKDLAYILLNLFWIMVGIVGICRAGNYFPIS